MPLTNNSQRIYINVGDIEGEKAITSLYPLVREVVATPSAALNTLLTNLRAITDGALNDITIDDGVIITPGEVAATGAYPNSEDKALLEFLSVNGEVVVMQIPCPDEAVFASDKETVDPLAAGVAAFISAMLAYAADKLGGALLGFIKGYRRRAKTRKS